MAFHTRVIFLYLFVATASSQPESCDIMAAVKCYSSRPTVYQSGLMLPNPHQQIVVPCQTEVNTMNTLKECVMEHATGCPSIYSDVQLSIEHATSFCTSVLECELNGGFHTKYSDLYGQCVRDLYHSDNMPNVTQNCLGFESCLLTIMGSCQALENYVKEVWHDLHDSYCSQANATFMLNNETTFTNTTYTNMQCSEVGEVAVTISNCYVSAADRLTAAERNVQSYCGIVHNFQQCALDALTNNECDEFKNIFNSSYNDYTKAAGVFCGSANPEDINTMCDVGAVQTCFSKLDSSVLKLEQLLMENEESSWEQLKVKAAQLTTLTRDLVTICGSVEDQILQVEDCISESMGGCPSGYSDTFELNTEFIRNLCQQLSNCTSDTFIEGLAECSSSAARKINTLGANETLNENIGLFQADFCGTFHELLQCMDVMLSPCTGHTEEVLALYEMMKRDLSPVCTGSLFPQLDNTTFADSKKYLACSDLVDKSVEIDTCNMQFLERLFESPTNPDHICNAIDELQKCLHEVIYNCPQLEREMQRSVDNARQALGGKCPEPDTDPPQIQEGDDDPTEEPHEDGDDDGPEDAADSLQASMFLLIALLIVFNIST